MSIGNMSPTFDRESFVCSLCWETPGKVPCSACKGHSSHCKICRGSGNVMCPKCKGHGRSGGDEVLDGTVFNY